MAQHWPAERTDFTTLLSVVLPLAPQGKQRARVTRKGHAYTPKKTREWGKAASLLIKQAWGGAAALDVPVSVVVQAYKQRPKRLGKGGVEWCPVKPDCDNVLKSVLDACTAAGIWRDDALVVREQTETYYCAHGQAPCVRVLVAALMMVDV